MDAPKKLGIGTHKGGKKSQKGVKVPKTPLSTCKRKMGPTPLRRPCEKTCVF